MTETNSNSSEEADLLSLVRAMIATKTHVVVAILLASALYWALIALGNLATPPVKTASINFYFTFKGAEQSEYPNKTPFQQGDVIAPIVLNKVYDQIGASRYLNRDLFVSGFTILPYIPDLALITAKYNLDKRGLSQAELEMMQQKMLREIRQASLLAATLEFTTKDHSIPAELIANALKTVPKVWADHMINNVGVSEFDITLFSEKVLDPALLESMDHLVAFELVLDKIDLLKQNISELMDLPNGRVASDQETGFTAPDLLKALTDTEKFTVDPLMAPILKLNASENPQLVEFYFSNKLEGLKRDKQLLQKRLDNLERAYAAYVNNQANESPLAEGKSSIGATSSVIPQFGAEFLDRLVRLTSAGADIDFRQQLTEQQVELGDELAQVEKELNRVEFALEATRNTKENDEKLREKYLQKAEKELPMIFSTLSEYFSISSRIYSVINENALGSGGMFRFVSEQVQFRASKSIVNSYNIRNYIITLFLVIVFIIPASMIYRALRQSPEQT